MDNVKAYLDLHPALFTTLGQATDTTPDHLPKLDAYLQPVGSARHDPK